METRLIWNDICRCSNEDCSIKMECRRYLQRQLDKEGSYHSVTPFEENGGKCDWKIDL